MEIYINTRGQNVDPSNQMEIKNNKAANSYDLNTFFVKKVFEDRVEGKYFAILGDSGMGKTTFMSELYARYNSKLFKKYEAKFINLSEEKDLSWLEKKVTNYRNTILLLDGLDENKAAMEDCDKYLKTVIKYTKVFYKVIISCRTQFFADEESEMSSVRSVFNKIYISPFSEQDVNKYLRKLYGRDNIKLEKAKKIVDKVPNLMVRPMLLSYIDELLEDDFSYKYTYQIYEIMIRKWMKREANYISEEGVQNLYKLMRAMAMDMYKNNIIGYTLKDIENFCADIDMDVVAARSRSLLNRTSSGKYKFAHKSILEYFLADEAYNNLFFRNNYNFSAYTMAASFFREMCIYNVKNKLISVEYMFNMDLKGANLSGIDLTEADMRNIDLKGANLCNAVLTRADLENADLRNANLKDADFSQVNLRSVDLRGANLDGISFTFTNFKSANLSNINLSGADLRGIDLKGVNLTRANLSEANLEGVFFTGANLERANLSGSNLNEADFSSAVLKGTNLSMANLDGALFQESELLHSDLSQSDLKGCDFTLAVIEGCDFREADLRESNLSNTTINNMYLGETYLRSVNLTQAKLTNVNMGGAYLRKSCLNKSVLRNVDLRGADLREIELIEATARKANFIGVDLTGSILQKSDLRGACFKNANLNQSDLSGCNLCDADFTDTDLRMVQLNNVNMGNTNLSSADLNGTNVEKKNSVFFIDL